VTEATRPPELRDPPTNRYWGDRKPPKDRADMFSVAVAATDTPGEPASVATGQVATLRIYGPIDSWGGYWGISARDVSAALDALGDGVGEIRVRINSPGGEAWEGLAILNMLRAHSARIVAVVDGLAASAASFVAAGCDETVMSPGTQMMIHDASTIEWGDAAAMRKTAMFLDSISDSLASLYAESAGGTDASWRALMVEETWYTAKEAVAAGLADRIGIVPDAGPTSTAGDEQPDLTIEIVEDHFDLSIFNYAGREAAPTPHTPVALASGASPTPQEGSPAVAFSDEGTTTLRQQLGVSEDADEATILAALTEALTERAEEPQVQAKLEVPEGMVLVPADVLDSMKQGAQDGALALKAQRETARDSAIKAAVNDGRITPASREDWTKRWDSAPDDTSSLLASLPKDMVPLAARGHEGEVETGSKAGWADSIFSTDQKAS
jgi:ATP-dependent protease ClpP protease subunit